MYIAPNSTMCFLRNVPLDTTFDHTLWFTNEVTQRWYFSTKIKPTTTDPILGTYSFEVGNTTYQRYGKGVLRVQIPSDLLYDCNYLMFQNTSYGSKWFYAFITKVDYVNNVTSSVQYIIDPMQTWYFDYTLMDSFVDREHSSTDVIGENIYPEGLEIGEIMQMGDAILINKSDYFNTVSEGGQTVEYPYTDFPILAITTINLSDYASSAICTVYSNYISGVPTGIYYNRINSQTALKTIITNLENAQINIEDVFISLYVLPAGIASDFCTYSNPMNDNTNLAIKSVPITKKQSGGIGENQDYVPRNKKLYCYPYNFLQVETGNDTAEFAYELFSSSNCDFIIRYSILPYPVESLIPRNYKASGNSEVFNERLTLSDFPQVPFVADVYKVYLAQNASQLGVKQIRFEYQRRMAIAKGTANVIGAVAKTGLGAALASATGGSSLAMSTLVKPATNAFTAIEGAGLLSSALDFVDDWNNVMYNRQQLMAQLTDLQRQPPQMNGNQPSNSDYGMGIIGFRGRRMCAKREYLERIDSFFDMYGYATKKLKVPNTHVRKHWTYTKTVGCVAIGEIPADDLNAICKIFDHGITFWTNASYTVSHQVDEVGKYNEYASDNTPFNV